MVAKFVIWGKDRDEAIRRARRALTESRVEGIETSIPFFLALLQDPDVLANRVSTQFLDGWAYRPASPAALQRETSLAAAALDTASKAAAARPETTPAGTSSWRTARPTFGVRE